MIFTGLFDGKTPGEYPYLSMGAEGAETRTGRPPYERMGCEISFSELPEEHWLRVLDVYRELWGL